MRFSLAVPILAVLLVLPLPLRAADAPAPSLTKAQQAAADAAEKALRKLKAATEIGVSLAAYQERLIDAKAEVDEQLRLLPAGPIKARDQEILDLYVDTATLWSDLVRWDSKAAIKEGNGYPIIVKYKIPWTDGDAEDPERPVEFARMSEAERHAYILTLWALAAQRLDLVEAPADKH